MNQALENILTRRSARSYTEQPIARDDLQTILNAAIHAPTGNNKQGWRFTALCSREKIDRLANAVGEALGLENYHFFHAPVFVLVSNDRDNKNACPDCACALENIFLAAHALGIGSCWVNQVREAAQKSPAVAAILAEYGIPAHHDVFGSAALGYAQREPRPLERDEAAIVYLD